MRILNSLLQCVTVLSVINDWSPSLHFRTIHKGGFCHVFTYGHNMWEIENVQAYVLYFTLMLFIPMNEVLLVLTSSLAILILQYGKIVLSSLSVVFLLKSVHILTNLRLCRRLVLHILYWELIIINTIQICSYVGKSTRDTELSI